MKLTDKTVNTIEIEFSDCHHGICEVIESLFQSMENGISKEEAGDLIDKLDKACMDIDAAVNSMKERSDNIKEELEDVLRRFFR